MYDIVREHLISVKKYIKELDESLIIALKAFDEEKQRKAYQYTLNATDQIHFYDAVKRNDYVLFKLEGFSVDIINNEIAFKTKVAPIFVKISDDAIKILKENVRSTIYVLAEIGYVRKTKFGRVKIYAKDITLIIADYDKNTAKDLLNECEPLDLICYALGYEPSLTVKALTLPRILPLFKPFGMGVHVIQFTPPETGKTHTAKMLTALTNSYHALGFPSRAKLIGDARFNSYGICYKYDAVYVEEFEKLSGKRLDEFKEDYESLLTGLEQGIWQREKSSRTDITYTNPISFCVFGNVRDQQLTTYSVDEYTTNHREVIKTIIEGMTDLNIRPFISRFTYCEYLTDCDSIMQYILYDENNQPQYLNPAISRAVFDILMEKCIKESDYINKPQSRLERHILTMKNILKTLNINLDDATVESLVKGELTFYDIFLGEDNIKDDETLKEAISEYDMTAYRSFDPKDVL